MKKWVYDTKKETRAEAHKELGKKLQSLPDNKRFKIEVSELRVIHSDSQSAYFHVICSIYSIETGMTLQEIKDEFKRDRFYEIKTDKFGREFKRLKSTSGLDVAQYASVINNLLDWGREKFPEVEIRERDKYTSDQWFEHQAAVEDEYDRVFSG